jgi:SpoVK/Ycf46/Vps4 family AAA+-type ATPase
LAIEVVLDPDAPLRHAASDRKDSTSQCMLRDFKRLMTAVGSTEEMRKNMMKTHLAIGVWANGGVTIFWPFGGWILEKHTPGDLESVLQVALRFPRLLVELRSLRRCENQVCTCGRQV